MLASLIKQLNVRWLLAGLFVFLSVTVRSYGQQTNGIRRINSFVDSLTKTFPVEKLYLQTDKPMYNSGDTLWLKGYLFEATNLTPFTKSGLVYIDLIDKDNNIVKRMLFQVGSGLFRGAIPLDKEELPAGDFTLRAYTNWMRNWGIDYVFTKKLFLVNTGSQVPGGGPAKASGIITANDRRVMAYPTKPENIDLQFMPEGGNLVSGIQSKVGFKAVAANGVGINVPGKIYNSKKQEVASFKTIHAGMGSFDFTPVAGENYFAKIITAGSESKAYALPKAEPSGVVLKVINDLGSDVLKVNMVCSEKILKTAPYYLIAQSRGVVCYGAIAKFTNREVNSVIPIDKFPTGIVRITLFDENLNPVNERITFVNHQDGLDIHLKTDKENYQTRDSVTLHVKVTDKNSMPVQGSFSVAVTDDGLVASDTTDNILTRILLTSDLKGTVENPAFYLISKTENHTALENLLLTQGWVGYHWKNSFKFLEIKYPAQPEFTIKGKLTNLLNKGVAGAPVKLFSRHPFFTMDTISNQSGEFTFRNLPLIDTGNFLLQALNKNGKSRNVGFEMQDEEPLPVPVMRKKVKPNYFTDSTSLVVIKNNVEVKRKTDEALFGKNVLKEVTIRAKKVVKGSKNLNGPGNADQILDEKDMLKAAKTPLMDFLYSKIKGFHEGMFPVRISPASKPSYMIKSLCVKLIFDGIDVENHFQSSGGSLDRLLFLKGAIEQFTAEDIKGMEVMFKGMYNNRYNASFVDINSVSAINDIDYAYIEITTRSGKGPLINSKDGFYLYKPLMPASAPKFYTPKYQSRETQVKTDFRSVIHWEPDVITNAKGEATVKLFTSDRTGNYTIIAEGSNMNGLIGFGTGKVSIKKD
jgi:hypothetical protein